MKTTLQTPVDQSTHLFDVADRQAGYFTAAQAKEAGYSYSNQSYHRKQGLCCSRPCAVKGALGRPLQALLCLQKPQLVAQAVPNELSLLEPSFGLGERDLEPQDLDVLVEELQP